LAWCVNRASCVSFKAYRPTRRRERQLTRRSEENEASVRTGEWGKEWAWVNESAVLLSVVTGARQGRRRHEGALLRYYATYKVIIEERV
jgi:hypothetical protein